VANPPRDIRNPKDKDRARNGHGDPATGGRAWREIRLSRMLDLPQSLLARADEVIE
jgi:hypothetical protein